MINVAILGFGIVGGGVAEVIDENQEKLKAYCGQNIYVKKILDLRTFPDSKYGDRVTSNFDEILNDDSISIVVETMGGSHPAYEFSIAAMKKGKSVVTSNKEVVANFGIELNNTAKENGVSYEFEAAVGGGIPAIRSLRTSYASDKITKIDGIINGTTNFILTSMKNKSEDFDVALAQAQKNGYAEKDPTADVEGFDLQRKISILTALVTGKLVKENQVYKETITKVSIEDIEAAKRIGGMLKYIASMRLDGDKLSLFVCPRIVMDSSILSKIDDVYNGIMVSSPLTGDVVYYGRGAGRYPTAGAVVTDIAAVASNLSTKELVCNWVEVNDDKIKPFEENEFKYYVRYKTKNPDLSKVGDYELIENGKDGKVEIVTGFIKEATALKLFDSNLVETFIRIL